MVRYHIPRNLLSEQLPESVVAGMSSVQKKQYRKWKEKYKSAQQRLQAQKESKEGPPKTRKYKMDEAKLLFEGKYHPEEEDQ